MQNKGQKRIQREFHVRQSRQIVAIAITLFLVALSAVLYKRPGVLGEFTKGTLFGAQIAGIALFIAFTAFNWRCPACNKNLGSDIHRRVCRKCGTRLK